MKAPTSCRAAEVSRAASLQPPGHGARRISTRRMVRVCHAHVPLVAIAAATASLAFASFASVVSRAGRSPASGRPGEMAIRANGLTGWLRQYRNGFGDQKGRAARSSPRGLTTAHATFSNKAFALPSSSRRLS